jgi:hypothetical protein
MREAEKQDCFSFYGLTGQNNGIKLHNILLKRAMRLILDVPINSPADIVIENSNSGI